ncbi:hypothetical protein M153_2770002882 [Pseudoloma neurophilia]|uniref:Uncharacterized protein n=1 Tax=Pseudoloma neurophilia TaxID=146866 RepID=A0A0R0LYI5_9MICR|nr:hypothetical protein M153_2770002882 [Pseudoloma neurophilia]
MDTVVRELKLNSSEKLEFLMAHINEDIRVSVKEVDCYEKYFEKILKKKYKSKFSEKYENLLQRKKQISYASISDYKNKIEEIIKRIAITDKLSDVEGKKLKRKWGFKGLHVKTNLMLAKEGAKSVKIAIKLIENVELIFNTSGSIHKSHKSLNKEFRNFNLEHPPVKKNENHKTKENSF